MRPAVRPLRSLSLLLSLDVALGRVAAPFAPPCFSAHLKVCPTELVTKKTAKIWATDAQGPAKRREGRAYPSPSGVASTVTATTE